MRHPSSSNVEAFVACTASHVLPQHETHSKQAAKGTSGHKPLGDRINLRKFAPDPGDPLTVNFPLEFVMKGVDSAVGEIAYAVDVQARTSRVIGVDIGRNYGPLGPFEIGTTLDVQGRKEGRPWIRDWKFGRHSSWWQLYIQAMAVLWQPGADDTEVDAGFVYIDGDTGGEDWHDSTATLYISDLDERADEILAAFERAKAYEAALERGETLRTVEGEWCTYCGALPHCPGKMRLVRGLLQDMGDLDGTVAALTAEQCGTAWLKLKQIQKLAEKMEGALKERMKAEPFPLPNGKVMKMTEGKGWPYFDREPTMALLRKKGATPSEIKKVMKVRAGSVSPREVKP